MSLVENFKRELAGYLRYTSLPDLTEVANFDEILHDPCDCCQISTITVEVRYYTVTEPFQAQSVEFTCGIQALMEQIDDFYTRRWHD